MIASAEHIQQISMHFKKKLEKIRVVIFDVDGILTDGKLYYMGQEVGWGRSFHARDGYGMLILQNAGLKVGIITGGNSTSVKERFYRNLPIDQEYLFFGDEDKRHAYQKILAKGHKDEEILYMGDEFFDMPLLKRVGFSATVEGASPEVQKIVDYVTITPSGEGCVREVIDILRLAQGIVPHVADF
jgi:3-deoxy-D-manno-octulosonate 8-phosphate phosphatase (KDO 8-P phosphatase)